MKTFFNYSARATATTRDFPQSLEELATAAESYIYKTIADTKKIVFTDAGKANAIVDTNGATTLPGCTIAFFPTSFENVTLQELEYTEEDKIVVRGFTNTHKPSRVEMYLENLDTESILYLADYLSKRPLT